MLPIILVSLTLLVASVAIRSFARRRAAAGRWRVVTRTLHDGSRQVMLAGPGGERVIRELPAALEGIALEDELLEARSRAFGEALRLNELLAGPAHAPRTRS